MTVLPALVTLLLLASARGGPINNRDDDGSKCATKCIASQKFQYAPDTTYEFDYVADTTTSMEDASEDSARLSIAASAFVRVVGDCDMVLQLRNVKVQESDPESGSMRSAPGSSRAAAMLERNPLRFSFQDGVVEELCPSDSEELWALNVKRGFLSAFQNSMSRLDSDQTVNEVDVTGRCPSEYHVQNKGWYSTTVKRSKDLLACTDRHDYQSALQTSPYHTQSSVQSLSLMKSSHECEQSVDQYGILSSALCSERHLFRPFSREASGALTKVSQSLKYKAQSRTPISVQRVTQRTGLMFEHSNNEEASRKAQREAEQVLEQLCRDTALDIRPDTPKVFSKLVSVMRRVDASGLKALYAKLQQNTICAKNVRTMKFFVDALPMVGSEAAVTMMTQMLTSGDVTGVEADMWLTSLALIQTPTVGMLREVSALVKTDSLQQRALLPVSTMVNNLCQRRQDCDTTPEVTAILDVFYQVVGTSCYVNKKNLDQVMMGLRAIGNAGHVSRSTQVINRCLSRSSNPMEVRVAAAQAFRRLPCDADRQTAMSLYQDSQEDSELRIAAYLAVMTCPDDVTLQQVQRQLSVETEQQVGSFVWSHLSNLQETSSPHKQAVRAMLKKVKLPAQFDLGRLQFSRNYEGSAFLKRLNSGAAAEANLVWASTSSVPRSASANLTLDLFGRSLNLLDAGVRLEGLEYLLETLLGPYGYFGQPDNSGKGGNKLDELKGSLYMRMFGNEMSFQRFQGLESVTPSFNMLDFLIKLSKKHDVSMTHSTEFLNTELTVPTSSGLPLSLTVLGTATLDLKASGKVDLRKVSAKPRSLQIDGEIRPSGAVRVSGHMTVDAMVSRAALHVTGTLHSSTALKGRVELDRGRVLSLELDVPEDKMEIFDISSEFSIVHNAVEKKQKMITDNRRTVKLCTGETGAGISGVELCGELQYPNASSSATGPYFPFTGPTSLSLTLHKRDSLTSYKLLAKRVENKKKTMAQLSFNTPGSKVDRSMAFDLVINHADRQVEISAASPWKKAEFRGAITNSKKLMGVSGSFVTDDVNTYAVTSEVKMDESKNGKTFKPLVEIRYPSQDNVALSGVVTMDPMKTASAELTLAGLTANPLVFNSALTNTKKEMSLVGSAAHGKDMYSVRAGSQMNIAINKKNTKVQLTPFLSVKTPKRELVSMSGSALYNKDKILKGDLTFNLLKYKPVSVQLTATTAARKAAVRYASKFNLKSTLLSTKSDVIVNVKKGRLINGRATVSYNVPRVARDKLVMMAKLSDRSTKTFNKYTVRSSMVSKSYPDYNTALRLSMDHKKKLSSGEVEVKYGSNPKDRSKRVFLSGTLARKVKSLSNMDLNYKMMAQAPQQNVDISLKGRHSHNPKSLDSDVTLTYGKGKDVSASLTLKDKSKKMAKMNGVLVLQAPGAGLTVKSDLTQANRKQWQHTVDVKTGSGSKHSLSTVYKTPGAKARHVTTTLDMAGAKPITVSGEANLDWDDLQMAGSLRHGKDVYGLSGSHKLAKSRSGKWGLEVTVPSRRMTLNAEAGKVKGSYKAAVEAAWDADKDNNAKVTVDGMVSSKSSKDSASRKARVTVATPFPGYEQLTAGVGLDSSPSQHEVNTLLVMGNKRQLFSSDLVVVLPFDPRHVDVTFKAETPVKGYGSLGLVLNHRLDSALNTKLTASVQKEQCEVTLTAENRGTSTARDLHAQLDVKSSIRKSGLRSLSFRAVHQDDGRKFTNGLDLKVNRKAYSYAGTMQMDQSSNSGDVTLTWPKDQMKSTWSHRWSGSDVSSAMTWAWGSNQRVQMDVSGRHVPGALTGSLALQTPWTGARDLRVELNNQYGSGRIVSSSSVKDQDRETFSHRLTAAADASKTDMDFQVTSPWYKPVSSKLEARYENFPMSVNAEFSWDPRKKVTTEGSIVLNAWNDLDMNLRVTTPMRGMRTLASQVSNKVEGAEVVGRITLDLGMRKNVVLETRVQRDVSGARVKLTTPWDELRVMDTGMAVSVMPYSGKVTADFKALPAVEKYATSATWSMDDDFTARLRLDTPREDFPYLQMVATSKDKRRVRQSRVELELSPRQVYSLDSTYSFHLPLVMDVNVATPLSGWESLSASLRHNLRDTAMDSSLQVSYSPDDAVKATAMVDWSRGLDSSLTVTTPFGGWEKSSATVRHEGDWDDFNSLADVSVGGEGVSGSLKFLNKMKTDIQLTLQTPWAEKIEAAVNRKGDLSNLRGAATVVCGDQQLKASLISKLNSRKTRVLASLSTPFTEDVKLSVEKGRDMDVDASASYGRAYTLDSSTSLRYSSRQASASTSLKYRAGGGRHAVSASVSQTGSLPDARLTASASLDKQEVGLTAELATTPDLQASLAVRTPFPGMESLGASFHHSGQPSAMTTEANVQYATDSNVHAKLETAFQGWQQVSLRGTLTSPLAGLERSSVSVSHVLGPKRCSGAFNLATTLADFGELDASYQKTGPWRNLKSEARVDYNSRSLLDAGLSHKLTSDRLASSLRVLTPALPELHAEVNHRGDLNRFTTNAQASAGADKVSSETQWTLGEDSMDLSQTLASTLLGQNHRATVALSRQGPLSDVTVQLSGAVDSRKAKIVGKLATERDIAASLEVDSPFAGFRQMGGSFRKTGPSTDLSVVAKGNLERQQVQVVGTFNAETDVRGSVDVSTPFNGYSQMGASFSYDTENAMLSANLMDDKIVATGKLVNDDVMEGNVAVSTPFNGYRQMGASFSYDTVNAMLSANLMDDKIVATGKLVNENVLEGNMAVSTPYNGYRQMGASFSYDTVNAMLSANLMDDKIEATGKLVNDDVIEGNMAVNTPFNGYRQMGAGFSYGPGLVTAVANVQDRKVEARAGLDMTDGLSGLITLATPLAQMGGQLQYHGDDANLMLKASGNVDDSRMEATLKATAALPDLTTSLDVVTPFRHYRKLGAAFATTAAGDDLSLTADAYVQRQKAEVKAKVSTGPSKSGSVEVSTPWTGFHQLGASFQQTGDLTDLSLTMAANLQNDRLQATASLVAKDAVSASVDVTTPFRGFRQVGASFKHSGSADSFDTEGRVTYMDGQDISGKVNFYNYRLRRIQASAELRTPFPNWEVTKASYKHQGRSDKFECNAAMECSRGQHTADLKVDLRGDQSVQLTVKTPYEDWRSTEVSHSFSMNDNSLQWTGSASYGQGQRLSSQLTSSYSWDQRSTRFELQTPYTQDLTATYDTQGVSTSFTKKQSLKYGDILQYAGELQFTLNDSPLWMIRNTHSYTYYDVSGTRSIYLRREGPWNDVTLTAKGNMNGESAGVDATFKKDNGIEGNIKINTPFEDYTDVGASFRHVGHVSSALHSEAQVEYQDGQEVTAQLDVTRVDWRRLEITAQLTTPFDDWTQTKAQYRHNADNDGFTCYAGAEYMGDQHVTGDLRVTSSPNPEVTVTVKTPFYNWEQVSANGEYKDDGWGKKEVSGKVDLGRGYEYTATGALTSDTGRSAHLRLTTPHDDWRTVEARVEHEGGVADMKSSAYLSTPLLDAVSASASLRYNSPFDLNAALALDTPFDCVSGWKMEMTNGERDTQKTSHVSVVWNNDQEMVLDGTWRHDVSWYERHLHAELSLTSPLQAVRQTSWMVEHHATQGKFQQKMTGSLNNEKLIDTDLLTLNTDLPEVTLTLREPYSMLYSLSRTSDGAEAGLDWDRNDPNSNVRLTSRFVDSSDSATTNHDLDIKVIHPSRTVGARYNLQSASASAASQGEVYWGRGTNRRVFYVVDLHHNSRRASSSYEGKVKVGAMSRAVQVNGAVSASTLSRQMDAAFSWDADRDWQNKQVALKTKWTSGEKNKADVTLSLPAINQEVRVQSEVSVNQGSTLLDATTALSYSQDASKVLTLSSKLRDTTGAWASGSNYTLQLTLTHPHTDLDVSMTSHLGASDSRYSAAVDTWYLTSRRQRKNMALRGEIDQLRRQISMEMVSPMKKVAMKGEVKSVEPYSVSLTNRYDDDATIQADVTLDTKKRSLAFRTNYDLDHPERQLVVKAFYVNDTAVRAELYRDLVSEVVTDGLLALRLNTSTLLHSRLHWRTAALSDLQDYAVGTLAKYASASKQSAQTVSSAVEEELSARYALSAASLAQDLTPLINLAEREMTAVAGQLSSFRRQLARFYRRNPHLHQLGSEASQCFRDVTDYIGQLSDSYQQKAEAVSEQMKASVRAMTQLPVGQLYQEAATQLLVDFEELVDIAVSSLTDTVASLDSYLLTARRHTLEVSHTLAEAAHNATSHPRIVALKNSMDITPYIHAAANKLSMLRMPEQYSDVIYRASSRANQAMSDVMNMEAMKNVKMASNEIYQQGLWAYHYWQLEENLKKHAESVARLLKEIVQEEMDVYTRHFRFLQDSRFTVWDPQNGEIQAETHLPVAMETLDSMPDMTPLVESYNDAVDSLPDMDTVQYFYDNYVPESAWWSDNSTSDKKEVLAEVEDYKPARRARRLYKKKYNKQRVAVAAI